jgi:hypothetical protein
MSVLGLPKIRRLHQLRDRLIRMLRGIKPGILRKDMQKLLMNDPDMDKLFSPDALNEAIGHVLHLYNNDFYQDPADKRWTLTRRRQIYDAAEQAAIELHVRRTGTTHAARIGEAMEAADA